MLSQPLITMFIFKTLVIHHNVSGIGALPLLCRLIRMVAILNLRGLRAIVAGTLWVSWGGRL
jgi:hypothetical protein